jgi:hypothetical protein
MLFMSRILCRPGGCKERVMLAMALLFSMTGSALAQPVPIRAYAVEVSAQIQTSPARIILQWPADSRATGYTVSRKRIHDTSWSSPVSLPGSATSWTDSNVSVGSAFEYQLTKTAPTYNGYGYIYAGINAPLTEHRGTVILVVDNTHAGALASELNRFRQDLIGDGWTVVRRDVSPQDSVPSVKATIKAVYDSDPANVKAVLLFGRIPVPYSGDFAADGHENHRGAWPADVYYGEMTSVWTDSSVTSTNAERSRNWNVPGDGKFDQSEIPSDVELAVGRVDFFNMTTFSNKTPSRSERDLLRQYLNKNHNFRHRRFTVERRGLICDNFGLRGQDPVAASGWRNFAPFFGAQNVVEVGHSQYFPTLNSQGYLWSYGAGGGQYFTVNGIGVSDDFATNDIRTVFTMFMGSYFGDWDNESNFLRAALGSSSYVLTSSYSGFPHSFYHHMALGETIGHGLRVSQNNRVGGLYSFQHQGTRQVHIALMGDPTLRMHPVVPISALSATAEAGGVALMWKGSPDSDMQGYHVYRAASPDGPFSRVSGSSPVGGSSFTDNPPAGTFTYMVRAIKLERSASGAYYNPSQGMFVTVTRSGTTPSPPAAPSNLQATADSTSQITITWNDNSNNESGFRIERKTGASGTYAEMANVGANIRTWVNTGLSAGTEYFYRVRAFNVDGFSAWSNETSARTLSLNPPAAPSNLQATADSMSQITITWNDNSNNESGFRIERKTGASGTYAEMANVGANIRTWVNTGLSAGTEYFYRVRAFNVDGFSAWSNETSARTLSPPSQAFVRFIEADAQTRGNWKSKYGRDGFHVIHNAVNYPGYVQVAPSGQSNWTWSSATTDTRALEKVDHPTDRIAAAWYSATSFSVALDFPTTATNRLALYFLDWDNLGRAMRVDVIDAISGATLDTRNLSNFGNGTYLVWDIRGRVRITLTRTAGVNALVNGLFFGGPAGPVSSGPLTLSARRLPNGAIEVRLRGEPGQRFILDGSTNFQQWAPIVTNQLSASEFLYEDNTRAPRRFFRSRTLP